MIIEITNTKFATIMREIHTAAYGFTVNLYLTPYRFRRMIESTRYRAFGYFLKNSLVGFLFIDDESIFPGKFIEHFAVLPWCQGKGIGSKMLSHITTDIFRGSVLFLGVDKKKRRLVNFYKKHGFTRYDNKHLIFTGPKQWDYIGFEEGDDPANLNELGHP